MSFLVPSCHFIRPASSSRPSYDYLSKNCHLMNTCYESDAFLVGGISPWGRSSLRQAWKSHNVISTALLVKTCAWLDPESVREGFWRVVQGEGYRGHVANIYQRRRGGTLLFPMCLYHLWADICQTHVGWQSIKFSLSKSVFFINFSFVKHISLKWSNIQRGVVDNGEKLLRLFRTETSLELECRRGMVFKSPWVQCLLTPSHELSFSSNMTVETNRDFSPISKDRQILGTEQGLQFFL